MGAVVNLCCDDDKEDKRILSLKASRRRAADPDPGAIEYEQSIHNDQLDQLEVQIAEAERLTQLIEQTQTEKKKPKFRDFFIDGQLGVGAFGVVYLVHLKE